MKKSVKNKSIDILSEINVKRYILPHYGIDNCTCTRIKFKDTEKQRAVYKIETLNKSYCLKKVYFDEDTLLFIYSVVEWLHRNGFNVPRFLPTNENGRYVDYNGILFILTAWIDGEKCSYDIWDNITSSAFNLSLMHKTCSNFQPIKNSTMKTGCENLYISYKKHFENLLTASNYACKYNDIFSKTFLESFEHNLMLAKYSIEICSSINTNNLHCSICHMDYVNKNILFDKNNNIYIIDFDKCRKDYVAHDISYFLRRFLKRTTTNWDIKIALKCLDCYEKNYTLNKDDYKYILAYLAFPQKYWKISKDYYNNIKKTNKNVFISLLNKSLEKKEEHYNFINEFSKYIRNRFK